MCIPICRRRNKTFFGKTKPVFVIATANDISALPPELLRKGRFDDEQVVDDELVLTINVD